MKRLISSVGMAALWATTALAEVPQVVTDIPAVHSLVAQVMGDLGMPDLLVSGSADAHSYQLRPSQARALASADLVFWIGPEMTPWLERALAADSSAKIVGLLAADGTLTRHYASDDAGEPAGQDHQGRDPHAWLAPANAQLWLGVIRDQLAAADPENASTYAQNTTAAMAAIAALDLQIAGILGGGGKTPIVVGHDAYGYFADHFGIKIAAAVEAGDAADPSAQRLSEIAALLKSEGVRCLFPEAGHDPRRSEILIERTDTRLGVPLDPEGRALEPGPELYAALLRALARSIAECQSQG